MGLPLSRRSERWTVRPLEAPRLRRYCPGCAADRDFACTGRFRMNAQKKAIDVWLNYRCCDCKVVWKAPILERQPTSQMDPALREAFERDDPATVWRYAFEVACSSSATNAAQETPVCVERTEIECVCAEPAHACFHLHVPFSCDLRLDRLLSTQLQVSRAQLQRWFEEGKVRISPAGRDPLRKRVRDGQCV